MLRGKGPGQMKSCPSLHKGLHYLRRDRRRRGRPFSDCALSWIWPWKQPRPRRRLPVLGVNYLISRDGVRGYLCNDFEARKIFLQLNIGVSRTNAALILGARLRVT